MAVGLKDVGNISPLALQTVGLKAGGCLCAGICAVFKSLGGRYESCGCPPSWGGLHIASAMCHPTPSQLCTCLECLARAAFPFMFI